MVDTTGSIASPGHSIRVGELEHSPSYLAPKSLFVTFNPWSFLINHSHANIKVDPENVEEGYSLS
jgi:hypothetical protein